MCDTSVICVFSGLLYFVVSFIDHLSSVFHLVQNNSSSKKSWPSKYVDHEHIHTQVPIDDVDILQFASRCFSVLVISFQKTEVVSRQ